MKVRAIRLASHLTAITLLAASGIALGRDAEPLRPKLTIDAQETNRSGAGAGFADVVDRVAPSVVSITVETRQKSRQNEIPEELFSNPFFRRFFEGMQPDFRQPMPQPRRQGQGSGVVLTKDGYIATNNHVIEGADKIVVTLSDGRSRYDAEIVGRDEATDVALIKVNATNLTPATLGDSSKLRVGDTVLAIGSPFGLSQTVTTGIVSALKRTNLRITGEGGYENFIQTDASINPGNSGGPLIDHQGRVVGINTAIFGRMGANIGIGFAIPINMAVEILDRLVTKGEVERGYLGVLLGELTPELAEGFGIEAKGVLINEVQSDTPAAKAGFQAGDVILSYQGEKVTDMAELRMRVAGTPPDTEAKFQVLRQGKTVDITAKIGKLPTDKSLASNPRQGGPGKRSQEFLPGLEITGLSEDLRSQFNIPEDMKGVVISGVDPDSPAADAGLSQGQVIRSVGNRPVTSVNDAVNAVRDFPGKRIPLYVYTGEVSHYVTLPK